uniref:Ral guanine nucleotide dissociation stimulator-like n=1 Tax=Camelus bactrianus TaxID=9837 RepID=A0A9W3F9X3_CAMBA|nr:ral guanine nucleotide dissociation stimulator-like [Camelus bactrianus]
MGRSQRQKGPGPRRATLGAQHGRKGQASDPGVPLTTPRAMSSILGTWLFQYPDDFHQPPEFPCLKTIVAYVELSMPGSDLEQQAHLLLAQLEQLELPEADSDAPAPEPAGEAPLDGEPAPALLPATAPEPEQRDALSCEASTSSLFSAVEPEPSSGAPSTLPETLPLGRAWSCHEHDKDLL